MICETSGRESAATPEFVAAPSIKATPIKFLIVIVSRPPRRRRQARSWKSDPERDRVLFLTRLFSRGKARGLSCQFEHFPWQFRRRDRSQFLARAPLPWPSRVPPVLRSALCLR